MLTMREPVSNEELQSMRTLFEKFGHNMTQQRADGAVKHIPFTDVIDELLSAREKITELEKEIDEWKLTALELKFQMHGKPPDYKILRSFSSVMNMKDEGDK